MYFILYSLGCRKARVEATHVQNKLGRFHKKLSWIKEVKPDLLKLGVTLHV